MAFGANHEAVADFTLALMLGLATNLVGHHQRAKSGGWGCGFHAAFWGATVGIVGLGRIGRAVARRCQGFGMRILAHDTQPDAAYAREHAIELVPLDTLLQESDFVTLHAPHMKETENLIGRRQLAQMKPTAYLVNTARGALVDEEALYEALAAGRIAGAGLDVFKREPPTRLAAPDARQRPAGAPCRGHERDGGGRHGEPLHRLDPRARQGRASGRGVRPESGRAHAPAHRTWRRLGADRHISGGPHALGYFTMPLHPPGSNPAETMADDLEQIVTLERLGFEEAWIGEHFTSSLGEHPLPRPVHRPGAGRDQDDQARHRRLLPAEPQPAHARAADRPARPAWRAAASTGASARAASPATSSCSTSTPRRESSAGSPARCSTRCSTSGTTRSRASASPSAGGSACPSRRTTSASSSTCARTSGRTRRSAWPAYRPESDMLTLAGERGWIPMSINIVPTPLAQDPLADLRRGGDARPAGRPTAASWRIARDVYVGETPAQARRDVLDGTLGRDWREYFLPLLRKTSCSRPKVDPEHARRRGHARVPRSRTSGSSATPTRSPPSSAAVRRRRRLRHAAGDRPRVAAARAVAELHDHAPRPRAATPVSPQAAGRPIVPSAERGSPVRVATSGEPGTRSMPRGSLERSDA